MGYFIEVQPDLQCEDLYARYGIEKRANGTRRPCEFTDAHGNRCPFHTAIWKSPDGGWYCYFHHPWTVGLVGQSPEFDDIERLVSSYAGGDVEECSTHYYFNNHQYITQHLDQINTIVEVGCFTGGYSAVGAQIAKRHNLPYYIIDFNLNYLLFTYERLARIDPDCVRNVRLYHGTLRDFVETHGKSLASRSIYLHIDADHSFNGVLNDLIASHPIRHAVHAIGCHDYHLRSRDVSMDIFVDRAIFAVFGIQAQLRPAGFFTGPAPTSCENPQQLYCQPNYSEGVIINLSENGYCVDAIPAHPSVRKTAKRIYRLVTGLIDYRLHHHRVKHSLEFCCTPGQMTGLRTVFSIEANSGPTSRLTLTPGEERDLNTLRRVFVEYDGGRMYSELTDKSQLEASVTDSGIIEMRGSKIVGLKPGGAQVRLQYGQCEADLQVLVSEAVPYVWTPEIPHCRFFEEMKKVPNALIVEVGSYNVIDLMPRHHLNPDAKVVGVDIRAGDNVDVVCDAHQLSSKLQPGTFDGVYSCSVFEHLAIPWQVVLEINRVLKIGGVAHVATIHTFPVHEMPWDFWRYGKHCFPSLFGPKSGFEIINHCVQLPGEFRYPVTGHRFRVGERIYLFSMVTARKVAEYDESRFHWRIPIEEILPKDHFYPDREDLYRTMAQSKGTPEEGYRMIDQYFQSLTGSRSARLLVLHSTNANNSIDDRFVSSYLRNHSAGILNGQGTHLDVVVRDYRTVEDALNLYRLPEEFGEEQFDFVLASDVLRLTEYPWKAALMISKMLKKDGRLLVKDWQARPIDVEPDYWRMTREAYRVLFNPRFGMNVEQTIHTDAVELFPEGVALKCYDHTIPCYFTTIGLATKVGPCNATGLRWDE